MKCYFRVDNFCYLDTHVPKEAECPCPNFLKRVDESVIEKDKKEEK